MGGQSNSSPGVSFWSKRYSMDEFNRQTSGFVASVQSDKSIDDKSRAEVLNKIFSGSAQITSENTLNNGANVDAIAGNALSQAKDLLSMAQGNGALYMNRRYLQERIRVATDTPGQAQTVLTQNSGNGSGAGYQTILTGGR